MFGVCKLVNCSPQDTIMMMSSLVSTQSTSVTDRWTDGQTLHDSIYRSMHMHTW